MGAVQISNCMEVRESCVAFNPPPIMIQLKYKMYKILRSSLNEKLRMRKQLFLTKAAVQSDWILMIWLDNWEWAGMKETGRKLWRPTHYLDSTRLDFTRPQFSFSNIADYLCSPSLVFFSLFTWLSELVEQVHSLQHFTLLYSLLYSYIYFLPHT